MATALKLRRGTTAQHSAFTGELAEVTVDTDKDTVVVHDGSTAGGFPLAKANGSAINPTSVGATTAGTGAFTTLSASSTVSGTGFSNYLASPPAIGGTAAAAVSSTNLAYTGTLTGGTGVIAIGTNQIYKDASGFVGLGTATPTDSAGFGRAIDIQSATGAGLYLRDSDAPTTSYTYLAYAGSNSTAYIWNVGNGAILFGTNDVQRLSISAAGTVALAATSGLTVGRTGVTSPASTDGNVFSGTYTPSLTNTTNIAASSISTCQYMRVGNVVTVSGQVTIDPTAAGACNMKMTLPIASNFGSSREAGGTFATLTSGQSDHGGIIADATGDQFEFRFTAVNISSAIYTFHVTYNVS